MLHETHTIDIDYEKLSLPHNEVHATYTTYILDSYPEYQNPKNRPLVIICPGGGYGHHSPREGEAVAIKFNNYGYNAIVLRYSLTPNTFPCALYELAYVVSLARKNASAWDINPDKIIVAGFSAGAHVAGSLATLWNKAGIDKALDIPCEAFKPNGFLAGYPVITSGEHAHRDSFIRLLGEDYDRLIDYVSLEKQVDCDTPPTFIWHTFEDAAVPVENSLLLADALHKQGIDCELHIFPHGSHGLGLATKETDTKDGKKYQPECAVWTDLFATWVNNL